MNKIAALLVGSALTALIANTAFAADAAPSTTKAITPAAASSTPAPAAPIVPATAAPANAAPAATEPAIKIGFVDMTKVASESKAGKAAEAALKAKSDKLRAKIEAKQKQLEKQKNALEAKIETLSPKERQAKGKEFQKKVEEYQKMVRSSEDEMQVAQEKLTGELFRTIKKAATSYGKSHGYTAVLEEKTILYITDTIEPKDLTEEIAASLSEKPQPK